MRVMIDDNYLVLSFLLCNQQCQSTERNVLLRDNWFTISETNAVLSWHGLALHTQTTQSGISNNKCKYSAYNTRRTVTSNCYQQ